LKSQQENLQPNVFQIFFGKATQILQHVFLLGGFNPFEKYDNQIGSFPQVKVNMKKYWKRRMEPSADYFPLRYCEVQDT